MHASAKIETPQTDPRDPTPFRNDVRFPTGTGGKPIKAQNAYLVAGLADPVRASMGRETVEEGAGLHPGNPEHFEAGRIKLSSAEDLLWFRAQQDIAAFKAAQEAEPKPARHASAPEQQLRPRAEIVVFTEQGCYAVDKGDYILFPGGGVDDGEPADFAAHREAIEESDLHPLNVEARGVVETIWPKGVSKFQDSSSFDGERTYFFTGIDGGLLGTKHHDRERFEVIPFEDLIDRLTVLINDPKQAWAQRNNEVRLDIVKEARRRAQLGGTFLRRKYAAEAMPKARGWTNHRRALKRVFAPKDPDAFIKAINEIERRIGHDVFEAVKFGDDRVLLVLRTPDVEDVTHHDHNLGREINQLAKTAGVPVSGSMCLTADADVPGPAIGLLVDLDGTCVDSTWDPDAVLTDQVVRPNVAEVLTAYADAGVRIVAVTNRFADPDGEGSRPEDLQGFNEETLELLPQITDIVCCPDLDDAGRKPSPAMLDYAMERFRLKSVIAFVGDSSVDREAAEASGLHYLTPEDFFGAGEVEGKAMPLLRAHGLGDDEESPEGIEKKADAAKFSPMPEYYYTNEKGDVLAQRLPDRRFAFPTKGKGKRAPYSNPFRFIPDEGVPEPGVHGYEYGFNVGEGEAPKDFKGEWIPGKEILTQTYGSMGLARNRRYHGLDRARARVLQRILAKHLTMTAPPQVPAEV